MRVMKSLLMVYGFRLLRRWFPACMNVVIRVESNKLLLKKIFCCCCVSCLVVVASGCAPPQGARGLSIQPQSAIVGAGQIEQFTAGSAAESSGVVWSVDGVAGGNSAVGTIDTLGNYTAPAMARNGSAAVSATRDSPQESAAALVTIIAAGQVTVTNNVQVAQYVITPPAAATVSVQFGLDTGYRLTTWEQRAPTVGGPVAIFVAGMLAGRTYHMRATIKFDDGSQFSDSDHTFTTGEVAIPGLPKLVATTTGGFTPQPGIELVNLLTFRDDIPSLSVVTDLDGNVLWSYSPEFLGAIANPIKMMPNGHFLINFTGGPDGSVLQEVDLSGQVVWQMTAMQLNQALAAATCPGCTVEVADTTHDVAILPNGHLIVMAQQNRFISDLINESPQWVTGDVLIDLDQNRKPVWVWSAFDHLDVNRHPMQLPDWTHANAVVYSPDDKALILSMRHQAWVVKIDYNDGQGAGDILWRLGYQGDFLLQGGTDPEDWFYAQHDANIVSVNSSGVFQLMLFDNGNQRVLDSSGDSCGNVTLCVSARFC
jgi:arylsulfate sulfotransferase